MVSTRSSSRAASRAPDAAPTPRSPKPPSRRRARRPPWAHAPSRVAVLWMAVSLPLVAWDTLFVLLRPHTFDGGRLHWPIWVPYKLYGHVDHIYGRKAFDARNGFTAAQAFLNLVESIMYAAYLWLCLRSPARSAALAVLVGFSAAVMTLSKTVLYWMNEYYSGFDNIGHNDFMTLLFLWIIPNGAWLVGSAYMVCSLGGDIVRGLEMASAHAKEE